MSQHQEIYVQQAPRVPMGALNLEKAILGTQEDGSSQMRISTRIEIIYNS